MKKLLLTAKLICCFAFISFSQNTPLSMNGRLKLVGNQLSNQCGSPVQLQGMSTHSALTYKNCLTEAGIASLAAAGSDLIRLAIYTEQTGIPPNHTPPYQADSVNNNAYIVNIVNLAEKYGMYVIIDWHILDDRTPTKHQEAAKKFFATMSRNFKNKRHVIYEIANEPNGGTSWSTIKAYANTIIPIIRKNDKEGIILVGTPEWSSQPMQAAIDKITGNNAYNVMYTFHFYSGSHYNNYQSELQNAASKIPMFVSEWGTTNADGGGGANTGNSDTWINIMKNLKLSWANWSFSDKSEGSAALNTGACASQLWTSRTNSGTYVFGKLSSADGFTQCPAAADDDKDGIPNGDDNCPNTVANTTVDAKGCPALQGDADVDGVIDANDLCANTTRGSKVNAWGCPMELNFSSNVCMGFNNYQGYARTDFSLDSLANMEFWNRPSDKSPVYSATTSAGKLVVNVTKADPAYATMGFSFGEKVVPNGKTFDTTLFPLDIRKYPVVKFDMIVNPTNYSATDVLIDVQLEDADSNSISTDNLGVLFRKPVNVNTQTSIICDFAGGALESYDVKVCGPGVATPCYITKFDFSRVTKVKVWVNAGAGETWSRPAFTGTWTIDNFSVGYNSAQAYTPACTSTRDDDKDGVIQEFDKCTDTPPGATVNISGCAQSQLDDDKDGVVNSNDLCKTTPVGAVVNGTGCTAAEADDDGDGVKNDKDLCQGTTPGTVVNASGCPITTGLKGSFETTGVSVYPIPASENLTIDQNTMNFTKASVLDLSGIVFAEKMLGSLKETISLSNLLKGVYVVKLAGAERSEYFKIIVE